MTRTASRSTRSPEQRRRRRDRAYRGIALLAGIGLLVFAVVRSCGVRESAPPAAACASGAPATVRGIVGSEKEEFFRDPAVLDRFRCVGFDVTVDLAGSRDMVARLAADRAGFDFAFPGSTATAEKIEQARGVTEVFTPFSSPMAVATFAPIVDVLTAAGVVHPGADGAPVVDVRKLLDLAKAGTTWDELPGNTTYRVTKTVLLSTTDPQDSNSAIMYLSIASQVANGGAVVTTAAQVDAVLPDLCRLIAYQGQKPETSQVLMDYYLGGGGLGRIPMGLVYEAQYLSAESGPSPSPLADRRLLYPSPTVYSRHTVVPFDDGGKAVGKLLHDDPELLRLAALHGFRPERATQLPIASRPGPSDVVESPSFDILESMIAGLGGAGTGTGRCAS